MVEEAITESEIEMKMKDSEVNEMEGGSNVVPVLDGSPLELKDVQLESKGNSSKSKEDTQLESKENTQSESKVQSLQKSNSNSFPNVKPLPESKTEHQSTIEILIPTSI